MNYFFFVHQSSMYINLIRIDKEGKIEIFGYLDCSSSKFNLLLVSKGQETT